jgi:hypothetical protein
MKKKPKALVITRLSELKSSRAMLMDRLGWSKGEPLELRYHRYGCCFFVVCVVDIARSSGERAIFIVFVTMATSASLPSEGRESSVLSSGSLNEATLA